MGVLMAIPFAGANKDPLHETSSVNVAKSALPTAFRSLNCSEVIQSDFHLLKPVFRRHFPISHQEKKNSNVNT